jgi:hypothetical protein
VVNKTPMNFFKQNQLEVMYIFFIHVDLAIRACSTLRIACVKIEYDAGGGRAHPRHLGSLEIFILKGSAKSTLHRTIYDWRIQLGAVNPSRL